jgi:hypothetical protein
MKRPPRAKARPRPPSPEEEEPEGAPSQEELETTLLEFLVNRREGQRDRRRQLWAQLAGL